MVLGRMKPNPPPFRPPCRDIATPGKRGPDASAVASGDAAGRRCTARSNEGAAWSVAGDRLSALNPRRSLRSSRRSPSFRSPSRPVRRPVGARSCRSRSLSRRSSLRSSRRSACRSALRAGAGRSDHPRGSSRRPSPSPLRDGAARSDHPRVSSRRSSRWMSRRLLDDPRRSCEASRRSPRFS